jgi:sortase A
MLKENNITSAYVMILSGVFLLFVSVLFFIYWWSNKSPIVEYVYTYSDVQEINYIEEGEWRLKIDKIDVESPIILNVDGNDEREYLSSLQRGVAHLRGTKIPGQVGNIFIFGHSSYLFYDPGDYKTIFKRLDNLDEGDEINIISNLKTYNYKVIDKKIVNPDDVEVVGDVLPGKETLSLMTCTPAGTTFRRLILLAERY